MPDLKEAEVFSVSNQRRVRILFVCYGNTCRSVLAEYIARYRFGNRIEAASVGIRPQSAADATNAIETLKGMNIDASGHQPRGFEEVDPEAFDRVVTMDPYVAKDFKEQFPTYSTDRLMKWNIEDPWDDDPGKYMRCAQEIHAKVRAFLKTLDRPA